MGNRKTKTAAQQDRRLIVVMCLTQVGGFLGFASVPALLPHFIDVWALSNAEAGWLGGVMFAGYMACVPLLVSLTDRIDARAVFLAGSVTAAVAMIGFAVAAKGFWTALLFRALLGAGLAGTYMPGMKLLTDRLQQTETSRAVAFYTATYGISTALSYFLSGYLASRFGWEWAFALLSSGSVFTIALVWRFTERLDPPGAAGTDAPVFDFVAVVRNRKALGYIVAYTLHTFELMALLSWVVAFLAFAAAQHELASDVDAAGLGALVVLVALPASILGNEAALRFGRARFVTIVMVTTAGWSCLVGGAVAISFTVAVIGCVLYSALVAADSASITAGTLASAAPERQGATIAVHSFLGFGGGLVAPPLFGAILDLAGGGERIGGWALAFAAIGLTTLLGPLALARWARGA